MEKKRGLNFNSISSILPIDQNDIPSPFFSDSIRFTLSYDDILKSDCLVYIDELASLISTKPSVLALLFKDPILAMNIFFGPCTAYQYRLTGPGKWDGARNAILTQWDRK